MYTYMYIYICIYVYITYIYVCVCVCVCVCCWRACTLPTRRGAIDYRIVPGSFPNPVVSVGV